MPSSKEDNRPATLWFWDDWFSSFDVQVSTFAAQGLWVNMLGIMAKAEIKGAMRSAGKQIDSKMLAKRYGKSEKEVSVLLKELEDNGVFSRLPDGTIINRRMFGESQRQDQISKIRAEAGKAGAEARWKADGKSDDKKMAKMALSSSSSSSITSSSSRVKADNTGQLFEEFWQAYPREGRFHKKACGQRFASIVKAGGLDELKAGFAGYVDFLKYQRLEKNFEQQAMHVMTFLNKERYQTYKDYQREPPL